MGLRVEGHVRRYRNVRRNLFGLAALVCALGSVLPGASPAVHAQAQQRLTTGGSSARSGVHPLAGGFQPDPFQVATRAGGPIHVAPLRIGAGCRGYVNGQPDVIVRFSGQAPLLRFFARAATDVTLVVADPSGRYLCNDDVVPGRNTNPMVDVYAPRPGQYDVWIGTPGAGQSAEATLFVTSARDQRP